MISKSMTTKYNFVVARDEMISYEYCIQPVAQTIEEIDDGESLMLCSDQHKGRMPKKISIGTSESHVFGTNYWCMFIGVAESKDRQRQNSVITKEETIFFSKG